MKRLILTILALAGLLLTMPQTSHSIPAFARKYGFNCNMCHVSFTKLNDFGQRYRDNGYQIPGQEGTEKNVFEIAPPLALRLATGHSFYNSKVTAFGSTTNGPTTSGFRFYAFDLFAAGLMHKNVSFLMVYKPRVDEPMNSPYVSPSFSGPGQTGTLESANIVFSNLVQDALNLRIGILEPAYQAISAKRSFYLVEPYEIYNFPEPYHIVVSPYTSPVALGSYGSNQVGMEASGHFNFGFKYGLGMVNGNGLNPDDNTYKDIYINLSQVIGKGEGQSAGQRLGLFGYYGWAPLDFEFADTVTFNAHGLRNRPYSRIGGNLSLNWRTFNLTALFLAGKDDKELDLLDTSKSYNYTGGFAELDYSGLINNRLLLSVLYNWVQPPSYDKTRKISAISGLARYYLGDWTAVNVALHGEYTHRQIGQGDLKASENVFTTLVDFSF